MEMVEEFKIMLDKVPGPVPLDRITLNPEDGSVFILDDDSTGE